MNLSVGIVGLPNAGKSTLFNALLKKQVAQFANYPFTTIEPNVGVVEVFDERLEKLADIIAADPSTSLRTSRPPVIPAVVQFVDIAGLVRGAHKGEGLGNQFLSHIREVDVIVFVLRDFKNENVDRAGSEGAKEDLALLRDELLLKDLETLEKRIESFSRELKKVPANDPKHKVFNALNRAKENVEKGNWLEEVLSGEEIDLIKDLQLLSFKKSIVAVNSDEADLEKEPPIEGAMRISAKVELELASLEGEERKQYIKEFGYKNIGLDKLISKSYKTLGLITFFTAGPKEVRAWTIREGFKAPEAAGVIHEDFKRGFIAAEIISVEKLIEVGGWVRAKEQGLIKSAGREEVMRDGDVVEFKFNV
ncbi:redox-regulated ATPase YchF [Candidatus Curtissbacteria bacterium RIFCSPLOWO2_01_FULL_39_62]|uniref:Redox-regulated ATPase YchF n=2 Tax=Candidatus Curtissiibacteriota TaxID=1752717 RepID=A0A1F5G9Z3_9BACT|nr:MAG: GTP-dependent nucleic acid-binding protein EngD [Parcubacteria group bacterium GW2011_GWC1_38_6]OGD83263.1 MAG: redox-regulated ATPase YchF [Candidatus Curtissbacteria bacterium RIFCSPHIGHO2_01_FULL_39_57]OGD88647.1 MAG: redox-regulated ATPase YchF [Candidatus Curtissbacteria bacterium RIFCSPHIGHO2_02_FULL_40_16b]OGD90768.1 MAG: redox-regulated ATPase YchF [Candidatus Curtissbacteria bacterium RIFCSPHIGHO2_12_FULL_38_37]OGE01872.1 MAG: redox-regulated ATPase YchF [Candidatus Curtissbact